MLGHRFDECDYDTKLDRKNRKENKTLLNSAMKMFNESGIDGSFDKC